MAKPYRSKRWQDDPAFVGWLCREQYAQAVGGLEVKPYLTLGAMLYLYEAWRAGIQDEKTRQAD